MLKRLHATGEFELCELGSFGGFDDPRALEIPWRYVTSLPDPRDPDQVRRYEASPINKFGAWKFEEVCLDFEPDAVFDVRDWWYFEHQERSPFRRFFNWAVMPAVDAAPQNDQWVATYCHADAVFGYTDWGLDVVRRQSGGRAPVACAAPPGADADVFRPVADRKAFQRGLGLPEGAVVVGMVARNQKRKLFPELLAAFAKFLAEGPEGLRDRAYLYLHTSYPDVGFDLPKLVRDSGVARRVLFTYVCRACEQAYPSHFAGGLAHCRNCGAAAAVLPDVVKGVPRETLAKIYNTFDVFVQYATNEGFGMPMVEAAACGVPVFAVDYSAMSDVVRKVGGVPVAVRSLQREAETHRMLSLPDNDDFVRKLSAFLSRPDTLLRRAGWEARRGVLEHYTYDRTAKAWGDHFRSVPLRPRGATWGSPPRFHKPDTNFPPGLSNEEWVRWGISRVMGRPDLSDSFMAMRMTRDLNWGSTTGGMGGLAYNDASALGLEVEAQRAKYDREQALNQLLAGADQWNRWEAERAERNRGAAA